MLVAAVLLFLVILLIAGLPLFFAMGAATALYMFMSDIPLALMTQRMTTAVNGFLILAIPFFYLAGELMNLCRLTDKIVAMSRALVGHIHGGLAQVNIFASMIFAGMSGSATADTAALGSVLIPGHEKGRLPGRFRRRGHGRLGHGRADHPAVHRHDHLWRARRRVDRPAASGRHRARRDHHHRRDDFHLLSWPRNGAIPAIPRAKLPEVAEGDMAGSCRRYCSRSSSSAAS